MVINGLRGLVVVNLATFGAGFLLLWNVAAPLSHDGSSLSAIDTWSWLFVSGLTIGVLAGLLEGVLVTARLNVLAGASSFLAACFALYVPLFFAASPGDGIKTDPSDLIAAEIGWTVFAGAFAASAATVLILARVIRRGNSGTGR